MSNLHRITWIDGQIRAGMFPNCRVIAERFEISPRQASRDVEYLRYSLGAPVQYSPRNNGYYYEGETFVLPAHFITQEEKDTLGYLAYQYRSLGGGQALQLAQLFSRLTGDEGTDSANAIPVVSASPEEARVFKTLKEAVVKKQKVEFGYLSAENTKTERVFCPYKVFSRAGKAYVAGYCELRQEIRTFRLDRIWGLLMLEQKFSMVPWFDEGAYTDGFDYRELYKTVVKTEAGAQIRKIGLGFQLLEEDTYEVRFSQSDKVLTALLSGVQGFSILSPKWLRRALQDRLRKLVQENFGSDIICPTCPDTMSSEHSIGGIDVAKRLDVNIGMSWTTYIGSVDGVLRQAGLWDDEIYKLMGMTGMGFHFIMHRTACPSSVTVYDWAEHTAMMDRIGIHSEAIQVFRDPKLNTFELIQQEAVKAVKESIDRGVAVVTWAPAGMLEFGLITGYDDEDKVFFVKDCLSPNPDPMLYSNLGISEVPYLFVQMVKGKVEVNPEKVYRGSLEFGVAEWNKEHHVGPDYASGRKAYANLIGTLERGDYDPFGLAYTLNVYADSKDCIARYLEFLVQTKEILGLEQAAELFSQLAEKYRSITQLIPFSELGPGSFDKTNVPELLGLVRECLVLEDKAMAVIQWAVEA